MNKQTESLPLHRVILVVPWCAKATWLLELFPITTKGTVPTQMYPTYIQTYQNTCPGSMTFSRKRNVKYNNVTNRL